MICIYTFKVLENKNYLIYFKIWHWKMLVWCSRFLHLSDFTSSRRDVDFHRCVVSVDQDVPCRRCPLRRSSWFEVRIHWRGEDLQRWAVVSLVDWSFAGNDFRYYFQPGHRLSPVVKWSFEFVSPAILKVRVSIVPWVLQWQSVIFELTWYDSILESSKKTKLNVEKLF